MEFNLTNCLDYVKSGMEAIIEDEVTSRFEAEELKNWNLLTRTNRHYEFISWRLTVIWVIGFFIRYVILMPCRVFICFVGVSVLNLLLFFFISHTSTLSYNTWFQYSDQRKEVNMFSVEIIFHLFLMEFK